MLSIEQTFAARFRYVVHFTSDLFSLKNPLFGEVIQKGGHERPPKILFLIDQGVCAHQPQLGGAIKAYCEARPGSLSLALPPLILPGGEEAKNRPEYVARVHAAIHDSGLCRHSYLVTIGGGAVVDMAGFAAATAHRGIRLIRIPTTVLSQGDAAVGVKNSVNAFGKKNFLGTFSPPYAVINDDRFLTSLSDRDWRSGIAEAIKVALIKDPPFFGFLERHAGRLVRRDPVLMRRLIFRTAELHLHHIARGGDPFEAGSSRPLDFGHWAAHILEPLSGYQLRHGEAVALGIALDTTYSYLSGLLAREEWERILLLMRRIGFDLFAPQMRLTRDARDLRPRLLEGLEEFREHLGGTLTVMLLKRIGLGIEVHKIDEALIAKSLDLLEAISCQNGKHQAWRDRSFHLLSRRAVRG